MFQLLFSFLLIITKIQCTVQYADSVRCHHKMEVGSAMMKAVTQSSNSYQVVVKTKTGIPITSGSSIKAGETVIINVPALPTDQNYIIESTIGKFIDENVVTPACTHTRAMNMYLGTVDHLLTLSTSGTCSLSLVYSDAESLLFISTFSLIVTGNVTAPPDVEQATGVDANTNVRVGSSVGIVIGVGSVVIATLFYKYYSMGWSFFTNINIFSAVAVFLSIINFALVINWSTESTNGSPSFLGKADWNTSPFPYHPILMISMTLNVQIYRYVISDFLIKNNLGIIEDAMMLIVLLGTILGILAVDKYKNSSSIHKPTLTSIHSWIGLWATASIIISVFWQFLLRVFKDCVPSLSKSLNHNFHYMSYMTVIAFYLTSLAACTGISDQLAQTVCRPMKSTTTDYTQPLALVYQDIPESCKYANGLGISVMFSTVITVVMLRYRNYEHSHKSANNIASSRIAKSESIDLDTF